MTLKQRASTPLTTKTESFGKFLTAEFVGSEGASILWNIDLTMLT